MKLFFSLLITLAVGAIAGMATSASILNWYVHLNKPWFNPPNIIFGPVWTVLYILMGIALYLIWRLPVSAERNRAMLLFFVQLVLNFAWSFIFFSLHQIGWALVDIICLSISIIATIYSFFSLSKKAGWLLLPYIVWVIFATILNFSIWQLNK